MTAQTILPANTLSSGYDVANSVRFNGGDSAKFNIDHSGAGNRDLVRSRQAAMETSITNASDTPALETLYTYTTDSDGVSSRPLAVIPTLD